MITMLHGMEGTIVTQFKPITDALKIIYCKNMCNLSTRVILEPNSLGGK